MSRRSAPLQINQFIGGLNTDASPLNFPIENSKDELNLTLNQDGSRAKRLGFDVEDGYMIYNTSITSNSNEVLGRSMYKWDNAGGNPEKSLLAVQVANTLHIFDFDNDPVSSERLFSKTYSNAEYSNIFSYAVVDGLLVVVNGEKSVYVYEYDEVAETITESEETLYIRDLFGVEATDGSTNLTLPQNLNLRPSTLTAEHLYNLRNQGFNRSWFINNTETLGDPVAAFYTSSGDTVYPSNADNINTVIYADPNDTGNRTINRFFSTNLFNEKPNNAHSPTGSFIIDALERGTSRLSEEASLRSKDSDLTLSVSSLLDDKTPGGAAVVSEFSGHIFYAGFSGKVEGGDSKSPRMSSYVLFSLRVKDSSDVGRCYQVADPTDNEDSVLVDTDGGFIRVDNAYNINSLVSFNGSLFVFAENGVWRITGTDNTAFSATNYQVRKVSDRGCVSQNSVVLARGQIFYWGEDNIHAVTFNELGDPTVVSLSEGKIQYEYTNNISFQERESSCGVYDDFQSQVRWIYTDLENGSSSKELVYDLRFGAFTKNQVNPASGSLPKICAVTNSVPFSPGTSTTNVTVEGVQVTADSEDVVVTSVVRSNQLRESIYLVITSLTSGIVFTLGKYYDSDKYDWGQISDTGYDSYLVTGELTLGEPRSRKQSPTVHTFFKFSETEIINGEPVNPSSCLISGRFGWSSSSNSNKWSTPRQAYRIPRLYVPEAQDDFDLGFYVISTRNRVRGFGQSGSLKFEGEDGKDMHLYGWAYDMFASSEE